MCRPNSKGGRRCPSHSNPEQIAARNARRREKYATLKNDVNALAAVIEAGSELAVNGSGNELGFVFHEYSETELFKESTETVTIPSLNITVMKNEGVLVDNKYFAGKQVSGKINYNNLDENSYKDFGFEEIHASEPSERYAFVKRNDIVRLSDEETKNMSAEDKAALRFFTSSQHEWLNSTLYGDSMMTEPSEEYVPYFSGEKLDVEHEHNVERKDRNPALLADIVGTMDNALSKGVKKQRVLYRGVSPYNAAFSEFKTRNSRISSGPTPARQWLDSRLKLGQELIFDGYQSTSINPNIASSFSGYDGGILYEILTPEGVNVTGVSENYEEEEVLLPRSLRYMVVGIHKDVKMLTSPRNPHPTELNVVQLVAINDEGEVLTADKPHVAPELTEKQLEWKTPAAHPAGLPF